MMRDYGVLRIGTRWVGQGHPCLLIAEIGQAHDGSLGTAHAYIDAVAKTGADAIKFQTHIASAESTPAEPFRVRFSRQDHSRYDYWKRMEFTAEQWQGLADHAREKGLLFLSTPFSDQAVDLLERVGMPAWKVGSGEVNNPSFIQRMAHTGKPLILSSGMSGWPELDAAVRTTRECGAPVAVLQCTTAYPCPPEKVGLNVLSEIRGRYECPVGLSDHSGQMYAGFAAATLGANIIETHVVFSHDCFGPDVPASITLVELKQLVDGVRFIERALGNPVTKESMASELADLRRIFGKSLVAARDLTSGHVLSSDDVVLKKPGTGIPASRLSETIGRTLRCSVKADSLLSEEHLQ
jgi:N-acetylneuraminate synthase